jgi:hypothetical protein
VRPCAVQQCVDDECGERVGVLCGWIVLGAGSVEGFAQEGVVDLSRPLQVGGRVKESLALRPGQELEGAGVDVGPDGGRGIARTVGRGGVCCCTGVES